MKTGRKLLCMLLIVCLFSALIPAAASASGGDEVTYKITVSGGNYGLVNGSKIYEDTVPYGESLDIAKYISMVSYDTTADPSERYYFKSSFHYHHAFRKSADYAVSFRKRRNSMLAP